MAIDFDLKSYRSTIKRLIALKPIERQIARILKKSGTDINLSASAHSWEQLESKGRFTAHCLDIAHLKGHARFFRALRKAGWERVKVANTDKTTFKVRYIKNEVGLSLEYNAGALCEQVQVGEKTVTVPIYETRCKSLKVPKEVA